MPDSAAVAQLDRVLGYEPRGRGFESCQPRQLFRFSSTAWTCDRLGRFSWLGTFGGLASPQSPLFQLRHRQALVPPTGAFLDLRARHAARRSGQCCSSGPSIASSARERRRRCSRTRRLPTDACRPCVAGRARAGRECRSRPGRAAGPCCSSFRSAGKGSCGSAALASRRTRTPRAAVGDCLLPGCPYRAVATLDFGQVACVGTRKTEDG